MKKTPKHRILKENGTFNARSEKVTDPLFQQHDFFDPHDLLQLKYEMLRRTKHEGLCVAKTLKDFGFSKPAYYKILRTYEQEGLSGLIQKKRGPQKANKLTEEVLMFVDKLKSEDPNMTATAIVNCLQTKFGITVHPSSIARALKERKKKHK